MKSAISQVLKNRSSLVDGRSNTIRNKEKEVQRPWFKPRKVHLPLVGLILIKAPLTPVSSGWKPFIPALPGLGSPSIFVLTLMNCSCRLKEWDACYKQLKSEDSSGWLDIREKLRPAWEGLTSQGDSGMCLGQVLDAWRRPTASSPTASSPTGHKHESTGVKPESETSD